MNQLDTNIGKLQDLGFSTNEAKVYLALIRLGTSKAGAIAKFANIDRSSMYNAMQSLIKKGLASYVIIGKVKWFQCSNTSNIINYLSAKIELAKTILPTLEKIRKQTKPKENVRLFRGERGIQTVLTDILEHATQNLVFGSEGYFSKQMPLFAKRFVKQMEYKGIKVKSITRQRREDDDEDTAHLEKKELRTIPSLTESPVVTNITDDKISIIIWSEPPEAILIENKQAADAYRDYFNFMWMNAKK